MAFAIQSAMRKKIRRSEEKMVREKKEDPTNTLKGVGMGYAGTGYVGRSTMGQTAAAGDGTWEVMEEVGLHGPRWGHTGRTRKG